MEKYYTIEELADNLKVSKRTLFREMERGKLQGNKIGGAWRFSETQINEYLNRDK